MPQGVENDPVAAVGNAVIEPKRIRHRSEKRAYAHPKDDDVSMRKFPSWETGPALRRGRKEVRG